MIDPRRWILVEAWLALGLRIEWMSSWDADRIPSGEWQEGDEGHRFVYVGNRVWQVLDDRRSPLATKPYEMPTLGVDSLKHELAHYLAATDEQRRQRNFGPDVSEDDATDAEQVIDAMLVASSRIARMALGGKA